VNKIFKHPKYSRLTTQITWISLNKALRDFLNNCKSKIDSAEILTITKNLQV